LIGGLSADVRSSAAIWRSSGVAAASGKPEQHKIHSDGKSKELAKHGSTSISTKRTGLEAAENWEERPSLVQGNGCRSYEFRNP
jgi:hypothetical protein